jgi:NAD(P)-dependent dehydrogenase (short-subunit alcohol dehydrogenase family)
VKLRDQDAVGAAGGIGRAIALALARRGCHLTLVDIDEGGVTATARGAEAFGVRAVPQRWTSPNAPPWRRCPDKCAPRTEGSTCSSTTQELQ